jgi:hypothetical protein
MVSFKKVQQSISEVRTCNTFTWATYVRHIINHQRKIIMSNNERYSTNNCASYVRTVRTVGTVPVSGTWYLVQEVSTNYSYSIECTHCVPRSVRGTKI